MLAIAWSMPGCVAGPAGASVAALAGAAELVAALAAARAAAGNADSARWAAARCVVLVAVQAAGSASPHAFFSVAGRPAPHPYGPVVTSRHPPLPALNTPVPPPSWNPAATSWPAEADGGKLAIAHSVPPPVPACGVPGRVPPTSRGSRRRGRRPPGGRRSAPCRRPAPRAVVVTGVASCDVRA